VLVYGGSHCDMHRPKEPPRKTAAQRGYGSRWQKARVGWLRSHPLCAECQRLGKLVAASDVDHITPHKGDMAIFWDAGNWQSLCRSCHSSKTVREDGGFGARSGGGSKSGSVAG